MYVVYLSTGNCRGTGGTGFPGAGVNRQFWVALNGCQESNLGPLHMLKCWAKSPAITDLKTGI